MSETRVKRPVFRWTAPKGFAALFLFFLLILFFEFLLVSSFQLFGLTDRNALVGVFRIPATSWVFTVSVSPIFHLLPITVLVVLFSSWVYLSRYTAVAPSRAETSRRAFPSYRREAERRRFRGLRRFFRRLSRRVSSVGGSVKAGFLRLPGVSYVSKRLSLARATVRSALMVLAIFLSMSLLLYIVVYPDSIHQVVVALYGGNPAFLGFVRATTDLARGLGQALRPLGDLGAAVNNALLGAAPGFRNGLASFGASLTGSVVGLDVVSKYVLSQSLAAWSVALVALFYGWLISSRVGRRLKGR